MKTQSTGLRSFEFYFPGLDTLVLVAQSGGAVVVRASRDTFSVHRKECFIHELAAEGFIEDDYRWFSFDTSHPGSRVRWIVDFSWLKISPEATAATRRFMLRLLGSAALLWITLMAALFLRTAG